MKHIIYSLLVITISLTSFAQVQDPSTEPNYRNRIIKADEFLQKGDYINAANFYSSVFKEKPKRLDIAEKAGDAFFVIQDYANAAMMYKALKYDRGNYPKAQLLYAMSLKQLGEYQKAILEFKDCSDNYKEADSKEIQRKVAIAIKGCELAIELNNTNLPPNVIVESLGNTLNSEKDDFAPIPIIDNLVYFSSMRNEKGQIYRSEKDKNGWGNPQILPFFQGMERPHFIDGSFTADRKTLYFTQCGSDASGLIDCEIYMMQRINNEWSAPIRLPDYINESGATSCMPFVTQIDDREVLYFVSDRVGGVGGLDIWYVVVEGSRTNFNFSAPINAGIEINTPDDEVSPFYDVDEGMMYFSSNGYPGFGGLDVFRAIGGFNNWQKPENLGTPVNSGANDKYYILGKNNKYGYFVSNRLEGTTKQHTTDDDIFYFQITKEEVAGAIRGNIEEFGNSFNMLDGVEVKLLAVGDDGLESLVKSKVFDNGVYYFRIYPKKKYKIEASKDGYETIFFEFETGTFSGDFEFTQDITLKRTDGVVVNNPINTNKIETATPPIKPNLTSISPTKSEGLNGEEEKKIIHFDALTDTEKEEKIFFIGRTPHIRRDGELFAVEGMKESTETPPTESGKADTYYKIQLIAVSTFKPYKFESVKKIGKLEVESSDNSKVKRVMLGTYQSLEGAKEKLEEVIEKTLYQNAYIVKYVDNERVEDSKIRLDSFED